MICKEVHVRHSALINVVYDMRYTGRGTRVQGVSE